MAVLITTQSFIDAWLEASNGLLSHRSMLNLILSIEQPAVAPNLSDAVRRVNGFLHDEQQSPIHTVAETIFPAWQYRKRGLRGVFEYYPEHEYPALRNRGWGTYAYRMLRRPTKNGELFNPLEQMITKMRREIELVGTMKSCYEIGIAMGPYELPLYSTTDDCRRRRGGPCLSHLSFKLVDNAVHLTAFYRSHDYRYKAFGNLLGLARLQQCVADETAQDVGTLVIHSSYAFLNGSKAPISALIQELG